jgi:hypothetical protein
MNPTDPRDTDEGVHRGIAEKTDRDGSRSTRSDANTSKWTELTEPVIKQMVKMVSVCPLSLASRLDGCFESLARDGQRRFERGAGGGSAHEAGARKVDPRRDGAVIEEGGEVSLKRARIAKRPTLLSSYL